MFHFSDKSVLAGGSVIGKLDSNSGLTCCVHLCTKIIRKCMNQYGLNGRVD